MAMNQQQQEIERLEQAFWQSIVDGEPAVATGMLAEPALMVSSHGSSKFDHAGYTRMARDDRFKLLDFSISGMDIVFPRDDVAVASYRVRQKMQMQGKPVETDVFDTTTWVKVDDAWRCVVHTESEAAPKP